MSCNDITLNQVTRPVNIFQDPSTLTLEQINPLLTIMQDPGTITLIQQSEVIQVCAQNPIAQFLPFYAVATQGQKIFPLPSIALSVPLCAINGIAQSQAKTPTPDFTVTDNVLTLSSGVDAGDLVFGVIQVA